MNDHPSAWRQLVDEWLEREVRTRPDQPIREGSVQVRDALEVGDQAFVLVSFDVDWPWPQEEDTADEDRADSTAVLQAARVTRPWQERDAGRSLAEHATPDGSIRLHEHLVGARRAFAGNVPASGASRVRINLEDGDPVEAAVVDGWFLALVDDEARLRSISVDLGEEQRLERLDAGALLPDPGFARPAAQAMYFSPLDLRSVQPLGTWARSGDVVAVATSIERYDEGGILRLRVDGIRADDDALSTWPRIQLEQDGRELATAVCGEYLLADTMSIDVGVRPWPASADGPIVLRVLGLRGPGGPVDDIELALELEAARD